MKFRGLPIAVAVLIVLGGLLYWSSYHKPSEAAAPSAAATTILKTDPGSVVEVSLGRKRGASVTLEKGRDNLWQITRPEPYPADQDAVSGLLGSLSNLDADRVVEDKAGDLEPYGLGDPSLTLNLTLKDGKDRKLLLGDDTPAGGNVYALLAGDPRIFAISSYSKTSLDKGLNDLRDKRMLRVQPDQVRGATLEKKDQVIEFGRTKDGWQILKPSPLRADAFAVDELVRSVATAQMDLNAKDAAAEFAKGAPVATVRLASDQGTETLAVRKNKDDYFAKSSMVEGAYKVDSSLGTAMAKNLEDFRNKSLFNFGVETPSKVELHIGTKSWFFTHSGNDWWSNGKKMDIASIDSLVEKLRDLRATSFPASGFTNALIEAAVTSGTGNQTERVSIAGSGIAKRDNEPSLYQLDPSIVTDLTNAANAIEAAHSTTK